MNPDSHDPSESVTPQGSHSNHHAAPSPSDYPPPYAIPLPPTPKKSFLRSAFRSLMRGVFILSIILNIYLIGLLSLGMHQQEYRPGDHTQKIALIDLQGSIDMDTMRDMRNLLKKAEEDDTIKGIILVVNSPGGQVVPSDTINRYIKELKSKKKVYAAIEQVGASGAYWISVATDKIYAQPNSMVGSIGVIYVNMVVEKTLKEKLGIDPVIVKSSRSPFKDHNSPFRMPTDEEIVDIRKDLDTIHQRFVDVVQQGRELTNEDAWKLADGDVHDGPEALENHMIDQVGFLDDAIDDMAKDLNLVNPMVIRYAKPPTLREMLTAGKQSMANPLDIQAQLEKIAMSPRILALWAGD